MLLAQLTHIVHAKRRDCHFPSHHRFLGPFVEDLKSPTTSTGPRSTHLSHRTDTSFPLLAPFARINSSPRYPAFRSGHTQTIHKRKRPSDVTFTMQLQCITEQETGHRNTADSLLAHRMSGTTQLRCPATTNGYSYQSVFQFPRR